MSPLALADAAVDAAFWLGFILGVAALLIGLVVVWRALREYGGIE